MGRSRSRSRSRSRGRRYSRSYSRSRSRSSTPESFRVHVSDLGLDPSKREIEKAFDKFGPLIEVWVARNPPCFAFVVYKYKEDADNAIKTMDGQVLSSGRIRCSYARPRIRGGRGRRAGFDATLRCYQCGEMGHFSRDCDEIWRQRSRNRERQHRRRSNSRSRSRSRGRRSRSRGRRSRSRERKRSRRSRTKSKSRSPSRSRSRRHRSSSKSPRKSKTRSRSRSPRENGKEEQEKSPVMPDNAGDAPAEALADD
ncbi:serine/arginine-rich splicing factor 7-like [Mya arenaria]|nr:serine/arginine-rich splicing factor 7-like [Mya arenaria]XP_052800158.1 serine/arginine-rich splicing factor 7-like [Mya arenaria]XP_052800159.1 serine/arginine-rich splicing factor 7-like [Mya arenaria]